MKLTTVKTAGVASGVKILVYGEAGSGKTVLCTTLDNPVIISAESGLLSAANALKGKEDIPVIEIANVVDLEEAYQYVATGEGTKYQSVCLDSISEIAEQILSKAKQESKDPRNAYGILADKTTQVIKKFRDLAGRDVYFSCKQGERGEAVIGGAKFAPSMPGQTLKTDLPYLFDEVFHLGVGTDTETGTTFRYLRTQPNTQYHAKDRSGVLDEYEAPDLGAVIAKIKSGVVE